MKISLYTLFFDNYRDLANVVAPNWTEYAQRHGYDLRMYCGEYPGAESRSIGFQKIQFVYDQMFGSNADSPPDVAWVLDLDIIVTNFNVRVEDFLDDQHDYFVTTGVHGLCNGSFIIKRNDRAKAVLEYMLANQYNHENEQDTLKFHLDDPALKGRLRLFPYYSFCSLMFGLYPERSHLTQFEKPWQCGDFVLHLAALSQERRIEIFESSIIQDSLIR